MAGIKTKSGLVITLAIVAKSLKADHGYTGADDDFNAISKFVLDNEIDLDGPDGPIDITQLKPKATRKAVKLTAEVSPEPKTEGKAAAADVLGDAGLGDVVQKHIAGLEERLVKQFGLSRPNLSGVTVGKSGAERRYDAKIKSGKAKFQSYEDAVGFSGWFYSRMGMGLRNPDMATKGWQAFANFATRKAFATTTMEAGGATVPEYFDTDLQQLVYKYGIARQIYRQGRTTTDTYKRPRATGDIYAYYPGEGAAGTDGSSGRTYDQIKATPKKVVAIGKLSREVNDDSAIDMMEDSVESITRRIAQIEDDTSINGTGAGASNPATYIPGARGIANLVGLVTVSNSRSHAGNTAATGHTIGDLTAMMAKAASFVGAQWMFLCSTEIATATIFRLAQSQGGATFREFMSMGLTPFCFGLPVVRTPVMNRDVSTATAGTIDIIFGDPSLAATFVERQGIEISVSEERYWDEDNYGVRGICRHDFVAHDLGATDTQGPLGFLHQT